MSNAVLGGTYNVTDTKVDTTDKNAEAHLLRHILQVFNLASGGATIDSTLVQPYLPTVL